MLRFKEVFSCVPLCPENVRTVLVLILMWRFSKVYSHTYTPLCPEKCKDRFLVVMLILWRFSRVYVVLRTTPVRKWRHRFGAERVAVQHGRPKLYQAGAPFGLDQTGYPTYRKKYFKLQIRAVRTKTETKKSPTKRCYPGISDFFFFFRCLPPTHTFDDGYKIFTGPSC